MRTEKIGDLTYEVLAEQYGSESYEWSVAALLRHGEALYLYVDSGCSCNGPYDSLFGGAIDSGLVPVPSWHVAAESVKQTRPYYFDADDVAAFAEKCMAAMRP